MAQWEKLQQLDPVYRQKVHELYDREELPMDVRHYLAPWIESQEWDRAARDPSLAMVLFQVLLENLDNQYSRFVQEGRGESFVLQCSFRKFKQNFQRFQEEPYNLASIIQWFLTKEREILQMAELPDQVQSLQVQQGNMEVDNQRSMQKKMEEIRQRVQVMDHTVKCLEEQQDEFDFKFQTHKMEGSITPDVQKVLQVMLNRLDQSRRSLLSSLTGLLAQAAEAMSLLVEEELMQWRLRQQRAYIGAQEDTGLEILEQWFTSLAEGLFQIREFLQKLEELSGKVTYDKDPVKVQKPSLQEQTDRILTSLLKNAFVVETQPSIPQGKGPLVLRTNVQFSVKTRFLVKVPELNHSMQVTVTMDKNAPQVKGYRRFNVLGTSKKAMNMTESMQGGMVADFRHLTLKEQKIGAGGKGINDLSLSVTEELHVINFETEFNHHGLSVQLETATLPVVVISNSSQQQNAWASVLWFNMLCSDHKNVLFFANTTPAPWPKVGEMLSWQFLSAAGKGLDQNQLDMIAQKIFGKQPSYDNCTLSWAKFSKENVPDNNFSLWVWLDGILFLVKTYLADIWKDGSVIGFINKQRERTLLKKMMGGTFLLRFSESIKDGGITFSWVATDLQGNNSVRSVQPFTKTDLSQIPFVEIIRNFQILETGNIPENPLCYLYPEIPKDKAFGKYYTEKTGEDNPYIKYIRTKLMFVSKESGSEGKLTQPMNNLCSPNCDEVPAADELVTDMENVLINSEGVVPLLSSSMPDMVMDDDMLQKFLNDPNMLDGISAADDCLPDLILSPCDILTSTGSESV